MKTKKMFLVAAMAMSAAALMAFTTMPQTDYPDEPEKTTRQENNLPDKTEDSTGALCPCSDLKCAVCNGPVVWTSEAYVKKRSKCTGCNGTGYTGDGKYVKKEVCTTCDGTGIYVEWAAGCRCDHCNQGFKQPNDC